MNKKTILILLVLAIAVLGFTMGPACAATTTIKMGKYKDVGSKDRILTFYQPKDAQYVKGVYAAIFYHDNKRGDDFRPHTYVLRKMTVYYKNKKGKMTVYYKNKKGKVITRTARASNISGLMLLSTKKINGYTPYKSTITYSKMTKKERKIIMNPLF